MMVRYREYLKLNRNILASLAVSVVVSAAFAQSISGQEDYLNTTYTLMMDYLVYFTVFGVLYYSSEKRKYLLEDGSVDRQKLRHDLFRIITSLGVSEAVYTVARWFFQYYFLTIQYDPYMASIISQGISILVYLIVINLSVKVTRLYKDGN